MEIVRELVAPVSAAELFTHLEDLVAYEAWMPLIHDVERLAVPDGSVPAWSVELRAQVGPFARSKRLRMERTEHAANERVVFERREEDTRTHSPWMLVAELVEVLAGEGPAGEVLAGAPLAGAVEPVEAGADRQVHQTKLTMTLSYGGSLWGGAVLQRVLDDQVRRGSETLLELVR